MKCTAIYCDESVTYWPHFVAGIIAICYFSFLSLICVLNFIWTFLDETTPESRMTVVLITLLTLLVSTSFVCLARRKLNTVIYITHAGFSICNKSKRDGYYIQWSDVSKVQFHQELWYGRKFYKVVLKEPAYVCNASLKKTYYILPIISVDEIVLQKFIPSDLLTCKKDDGFKHKRRGDGLREPY